MQDLVGVQADGVTAAIGLEQLISLGDGKRRIRPQQLGNIQSVVAADDGHERQASVVKADHVPVAQQRRFHVSVLIEAEHAVAALTTEVTVV